MFRELFRKWQSIFLTWQATCRSAIGCTGSGSDRAARRRIESGTDGPDQQTDKKKEKQVRSF